VPCHTVVDLLGGCWLHYLLLKGENMKIRNLIFLLLAIIAYTIPAMAQNKISIRNNREDLDVWIYEESEDNSCHNWYCIHCPYPYTQDSFTANNLCYGKEYVICAFKAPRPTSGYLSFYNMPDIPDNWHNETYLVRPETVFSIVWDAGLSNWRLEPEILKTDDPNKHTSKNPIQRSRK